MTSGNLDNLDGFDDDLNLLAELTIIDRNVRAAAKKGDIKGVEGQLKRRLEEIKKPYSKFYQILSIYRNAIVDASPEERSTLEQVKQELDTTDRRYNEMFETHKKYAERWLDRARTVNNLKR